MYPDLIADLRSIGLSDNDLKPLFRSAEQYIEMWEKIDGTNINPPQVTINSALPANSAGWNNQNVPFTIAANHPTPGFPITNLAWNSSGAQTLSTTTVMPQAGGGAAFASVTISNEGTTTVNASAVDQAGNSGGPVKSTVKLDKTPPTMIVQNATSPQADFSYWESAEQAIRFREALSPIMIRMEFRLAELENPAWQHGIRLGQVATRQNSICTHL